MKNEVKNFISFLSRMGDRNMKRIVWSVIVIWTISFWLGIFKLVGLIQLLSILLLCELILFGLPKMSSRLLILN